MGKPFMYIEQPEMEVDNKTMQTIFYTDQKKSVEEQVVVHIPSFIKNVICDITLKEEKVRGEIIDEKETTLTVLLEDGMERVVEKSEIEDVKIIKL